MTKLEKRIIAEAMKLHRESAMFPVKAFVTKQPDGEVIRREFKGDYAWMDELIAACDAYAKRTK